MWKCGECVVRIYNGRDVDVDIEYVILFLFVG